jgi:hypothetical protein
LKLYTRQAAFWNATRRVKDGKGRETRHPARIEEFKAIKAEPPMPPLSVPQFFDMLMEIGPVEPAGMGEAPIGWQTIAAWADLTGARVSPWQARLLRDLSKAYLTERVAAEDPVWPAPWVDPAAAAVRLEQAANEARLRAVLD